jgi:hypothetical protein
MAHSHSFNDLKGLQGFSKEVEKYLDVSPTTDDIQGVEEYLMELRSYSASLAGALASAEVLFAKAMVRVVEETPAMQWGKIKNSSTLVMEYARGKFPNEHYMVSKLKELKECIRQATTHYSVLVAYKRQEMAMQAFGGGGVSNEGEFPTNER